MSAVLAKWLVQPETLAWTSVVLLVVRAFPLMARYLDRATTLEVTEKDR